ncbi:hypothetical protein AA21291_1886 [Swaminathania salitolerans LMG 21291]|uniref:DUF1285 domain-containing protein n=2 Tax=Swaminathania salitolerans TaxID=182838 RepID=A0A511BYI1_9PROT|nr:hypothetical protein AA21291_1886 [Swaminathania salitolerans LMG 21291]GEL03078.1 hypothetical protein SSA02_22410 [Swaminathania salitolerans]
MPGADGPGTDGPGAEMPGTDLSGADRQREGTPRALPFLIRRDGVWLYRGSPIRRKEMLCLFASMLRRDREGSFWLTTPTETGTIQVEDAPFLAGELDFRGVCGRHQNLCLRTNVDELLCVGPSHPLVVDWERPAAEDCAPVPYVQVRRGEGEFPVLARLSRPVYYELVALAVPGHVGCRPCMGVWSQNCFFPLAPMPDPAMQEISGGET